MLRISVMVSGGGSNLQALIDAIDCGQLKDAEIVQVISSSPLAFALERAEKHRIRGLVIGKKEFPDEEERNLAILKALKKEPVNPGDNPEILAARVLEIEHKILPKAILIWQRKGEK